MPKLPPLNALKCLEAAARSQSFSRAAEELHVTQSAVSHQIRLLEDWFGTSLFERRGRQTVPTPKGEELAKSLAEAFDIIGLACKRIAQSDAGPVPVGFVNIPPLDEYTQPNQADKFAVIGGYVYGCFCWIGICDGR